MPAGRRHREPLRTATALIQESSVSLRPSSFWMGTPRIPNISQAANMRVNAAVDSHRTRPAPAEGSGEPAGRPVSGLTDVVGVIGSPDRQI